MGVIAKLIVALIGLAVLIVGVLEIIWPLRTLEYARPYIYWASGHAPPSDFYTVAVVGILIGILLFAAGVSGRVGFPAFVWILGLLIIAGGIFMLAMPGTYRSLLERVVYGEPTRTRLVVSYIAGIIRVLIGLFLIAAAFRRPREDLRFA